MTSLTEFMSPHIIYSEYLVYLESLCFHPIFFQWFNIAEISLRESKLLDIIFYLLVELGVPYQGKYLHVLIVTHIAVKLILVLLIALEIHILILLMDLPPEQVLPQADSQIWRNAKLDQVPDINIFPGLIFLPLAYKEHAKLGAFFTALLDNRSVLCW